jgi:hypothetical protein
MAICLTDPFLPTSNATMQKLFIATAVALTAASAMAQVPNCNTAPPAQVFSNRADFGADFYYNLGAHIFDLNVTAPITLTGARTWLYDQGVGNPPVPDQRGNTSIVDVYTIAGTRTGNETNQPAWTLIGSGTMIVTDTAVGDGESQINFPNLAIAAGTYGVAFVYNAPTAGLNPGPLHCLGVAPAIVPPPVSDQFVTFSNEGIQGTAWTGVGVDSPNLRLQYTPNPSSAWFRQGGDGCYFRPHSFYESFPSAAGNRDLVNTGMQWLNGGTSWLVIPGPAGIIPPSGTPLNAGPTGSSSSGNWDDALSAPITLPFTFNFPGGSTTDITVSSNGSVYLANVVDSNYSICGASYGSILPFRDGPARISGFYHDMDPGTGGTGAGDIYYEVDTFNQYVRVTWDNVGRARSARVDADHALLERQRRHRLRLEPLEPERRQQRDRRLHAGPRQPPAPGDRHLGRAALPGRRRPDPARARHERAPDPRHHAELRHHERHPGHVRPDLRDQPAGSADAGRPGAVRPARLLPAHRAAGHERQLPDPEQHVRAVVRHPAGRLLPERAVLRPGRAADGWPQPGERGHVERRLRPTPQPVIAIACSRTA